MKCILTEETRQSVRSERKLGRGAMHRAAECGLAQDDVQLVLLRRISYELKEFLERGKPSKCAPAAFEPIVKQRIAEHKKVREELWARLQLMGETQEEAKNVG